MIASGRYALLAYLHESKKWTRQTLKTSQLVCMRCARCNVSSVTGLNVNSSERYMSLEC